MGYNRNILDAEKLISKEELKDLYLVKKLPDSKIGEMYGVSGGRVHRLRNRYRIASIEYYQRHHKQELDLREKEFIIGVLLGDGHMRMQYKDSKKSYPQLMLEQSIKHREYIYWLKEQIKDWIYNPNKPLKQVRKFHKKTGRFNHSYPFQTVCHPCFKEFYDAFYDNKKKVINMDIIEKYFTEYSFAIWIMDDGSRSKRGRRIKIYSCSFTREENEFLRSFLDEKYGLKAHIRKIQVSYYKPYYCLDFSKESSNIISNMVRNIVIPKMQYKLIPSETTKGTR